MVRKLSVPIILGWLAITVLVNVAVPSLEQVAKERGVSMSNNDAPTTRAMVRMGQLFKEGNTDSTAMLILEGEQPLDEHAHSYYDNLIRRLGADTAHIEHIQDFWGDPLTAAGVQSPDGKAAYAQLNLAGRQGSELSNESVDAIWNIINQTPAPKGIKAYVTGPSRCW
jgi:RND superfamily putative drug exporter